MLLILLVKTKWTLFFINYRMHFLTYDHIIYSVTILRRMRTSILPFERALVWIKAEIRLKSKTTEISSLAENQTIVSELWLHPTRSHTSSHVFPLLSGARIKLFIPILFLAKWNRSTFKRFNNSPRQSRATSWFKS